jgi:maltose/moltooligosaccharide transporter
MGYALQGFFIGVGAVVASLLPWLLAHAGVSNHADAAAGVAIPDTVRYSFYLGACALLAAVGWTVLRTREYPPATLRAFAAAHAQTVAQQTALAAPGYITSGWLWTIVGIAGFAAVREYQQDPQLYILFGLVLAWGLALFAHRALPFSRFAIIMHGLEHMSPTMRRLVPVQFFSWLALFAMWIYTTPAVTEFHFGTSDPLSDAYNTGANWVGVLFGAYNGFAALAAALIPFAVARLGVRQSHLLNLFLGGLGLLSFHFIRDPDWLLASMVGVGIAWASILSLPYAMLADSVPAEDMGLYMGIFNFFIVIPQLVAASVLRPLLKAFFGGEPIFALLLGGVCFMIAGVLVLRVPRPAREAGDAALVAAR